MKLRDWLLPGAATILIGTSAAVLIKSEPIRSDLALRATKELREVGHGWATLHVDGRDVTVSGIAPVPEAKVDALARVDQVRGVRVVRDAVDVIPEQRPFTIEFARNGATVTVTGFVPFDIARGTIRESIAAVIANADIDDQTTLARGAPEDFEALTTFAVRRLSELQTGSVSLSERVFEVAGAPESVEAYATLSAALANDLPANTRLARQDVTVPIVSPYLWSANKMTSALVLSGYILNEEMRAEILAGAEAITEDLPVYDRMIVARGAPEGVDIAVIASYVFDRLAEMSVGQGELVENALSISGEATTPASYLAVAPTIADRPPDGVVIERAYVLPAMVDPYVWSATRQGEDLVLDGYVPNASVHDEIFELAKAKTRGRVTDRMAMARGAPRNLLATAGVALQLISRLDQGAASLSGTEVLVSGEAFHEKAKQTIEAQVENGLPAGFTGASSITLLPPAPPISDEECAVLLSAALVADSVKFTTGDDRINADSFGLLDRLVYDLRRCPNARFEVAAHTDAAGGRARNRTLSQSRAEAVKAYMTEAGIGEDRLVARGYGEAEPLVDNDSESAKERNRRIALTLLQEE